MQSTFAVLTEPNRRRILEEAAGIGGLAARRHEAELKLKAADENLAKLADIMAEVEKPANSLKRQAGKARKYRALSEEIAALEARLGAARWRGAVVETREARAALDDAKLNEQKTVSAVTRSSTAELEARAAIEPLRAAESEAAGKLGVIKLQLARLEAERLEAGGSGADRRDCRGRGWDHGGSRRSWGGDGSGGSAAGAEAADCQVR